MDNNFNNFFQQQFWNTSKTLLQQQHNARNILPSNEISSTERILSTSAAPSAPAPIAKAKLSQQPPHSTNRDTMALSIDNRLYLDGLRQQQQRQSVAGFTDTSLVVSSRLDSNNNSSSEILPGPLNHNFPNQKLNRIDIDVIRSNINSQRLAASCSNTEHHQHGTILFNTLNGGGNILNQESNEPYCISGGPDSTTPPPQTSMPPPSSASSRISTNIVVNISNNNIEHEKIKTPNSIRGEFQSISHKLLNLLKIYAIIGKKLLIFNFSNLSSKY